MTFKQKQALSCAPMVVIVVLSIFFLLLSASAFFGGQPSLTKLQSKHSSVNTGWNKGKHGLLWRVWWVSDRVWWTFLLLSLWCYFFFLSGEMFWEARSPHPGLTCWAMTTKQMASIAAHSHLWPMGFELPCREGLFEKPSWFNNIFSLRAAKALNCLTPVAPSVKAPTQLLISSIYPHTKSSRLSGLFSGHLNADWMLVLETL